MTRALGPRPSVVHGAAGPWAVLICCWGVIAAGAVGWAGVKTATVISGGTTVRYDIKFFENLAAGRTSQVWQHTPAITVAVCVTVAYLLAGAVVVGAWVLMSRRQAAPGDPVAALAGSAQMSALAGPALARRAARLRPSLRGIPARNIANGDIGLVLGELTRPGNSGPVLYTSWEDTVVAVMAPRSGKTTVLAIPSVLSAPGPVVATSNKADVWAATAAIRLSDNGPVWLFDPQKIAHQPQAWWWNPLRDVR